MDQFSDIENKSYQKLHPNFEKVGLKPDDFDPKYNKD